MLVDFEIWKEILKGLEEVEIWKESWCRRDLFDADLIAKKVLESVSFVEEFEKELLGVSHQTCAQRRPSADLEKLASSLQSDFEEICREM